MAFQLKNIPKTNQKKTPSFDINTVLKKEIHFFGNSFSNKKKERFYSELHVLLKAGLTLKDAIELIAQEQKKERDKNLLHTILEHIILGQNFSEAIRKKEDFSSYEYHSLKIGEETGTLQKVTEELAVFYKRKNEQRRIIISALSYPVVVLFTAFLAILFMLQFVVPMFAAIFKQQKVALPWITKVILNAATIFKEYWWLGFLLLLTILINIKLFRNKYWYKKYKAIAMLKIPFVGEFIRKVKIAQFTQAITLLTGAKVPLLNGIQLTKEMITFYPLEKALQIIEYDILQGKSLYESMNKHSIFDKKMISLIKVADESNQNETIFKRLTEQYNEEIEYQSKMISSTIEPFIILILGAIVGVILIAMYLPMFKLSSAIGN